MLLLKGDEPEGKPSWLLLHIRLYSRWRRRKMGEEGNNFEFIFSSLVSCSALFLFCKHKQWRYSLRSALEQIV